MTDRIAKMTRLPPRPPRTVGLLEDHRGLIKEFYGDEEGTTFICKELCFKFTQTLKDLGFVVTLNKSIIQGDGSGGWSMWVEVMSNIPLSIVVVQFNPSSIKPAS